MMCFLISKETVYGIKKMKTNFLAVFLLCAYCAIYAEELLDVPFVITAENKIEIPAEVNGVFGFFQFDTGTVPFCLFEKIKSFDFAGVYSQTIRGVRAEYQAYAVSGFQAGIYGVKRRFPAITLERDFWDVDSRWEKGIFGIAPFLLAHAQFGLFSSENRIRELRFIPKDFIASDLLVHENTFYIIAKIGSSEIPAKIDTGNSACVSVPKALAGERVGVLGVQIAPNDVSVVDSLQDYIVLGVNFLRKFDVIFDIGNRTFYYKKLSECFGEDEAK